MTSDEFWDWVAAGYPQRWAFWRLRDEMDGFWLGVTTGLAISISLAVLAACLVGA
jgi:hypothetical protein